MTTGSAESRQAGNAHLVFPKGQPNPRALAFASALPPDPEHLLVVLDWVTDGHLAQWEPVGRLLADGDRPVRLVLGRPDPQGPAAIGQWLAERLRRPVTVAVGPLGPAAGGALFVPADSAGGWIRYGHGLLPQYVSRRFPRPDWDGLLPWDTMRAGVDIVAEPLPAGVWLRGDLPPHRHQEHRRWLMNTAPSAVDQLDLVLGCPGTPAVPLADVAEYWQGLPGPARAAVRFVPYGPVERDRGLPMDRLLAELLGEPVAVWSELHRPAAAPQAVAVPEPPVPAVVGPASAVGAAGTELPTRPVPDAPPAQPAQAVRAAGTHPVAPPPSTDATGPDADRLWLRATFGRRFNALASAVSRLLSRSPGLRGAGTLSDEISDLVAVQLYLDGDAEELAAALRAGGFGEHLRLGRCIEAGLHRLPTHRGAVALRARLSRAELDWYGAAGTVTEWGIARARAAGPAGLPGNVDVLIWSSTARRAGALDPAYAGLVLFRPGTAFRVLTTRFGEHPAVLLRELLHDEADQAVASGSGVDRFALAGLAAAEQAWAGNAHPPEYRLDQPPGLIVTPA